MTETLTADEIAANFSAMDDSVALINATVADDTEALASQSAEEVKLMITRNTDHLEIQAAKDWYSTSLMIIGVFSFFPITVSFDYVFVVVTPSTEYHFPPRGLQAARVVPPHSPP